MEKLIRLVANNKTVEEQTELMERMTEVTEFIGVALACTVVVMAMAIV